jgi:hypothetical protein
MKNQKTPLLDTAYEYLELNYNIFPITPGEKTPYAKALPGGSQNSTLENPLSEEAVEKIWTDYPDANIGVHTGAVSGIAVIDIDVAKNDADVEKGKRTPEQATILAQQFLAMFGETRVHKSPSGGYHLLYRYTPLCDGIGRKINAFKSQKGAVSLVDNAQPVELHDIDVLAGEGYIVAPPSVLKVKNGETEEAAESPYILLNEVDSFEMPDFPEELIRLVSRRDRVSKSFFSLKDGTATPIPETSVKERNLISQWENGGKNKLMKKLHDLMGAGAGERHDHLLKTCGTVFAFLPYKEWKQANSFIDMVIATFSPQYMIGSEAEIDADKREIQNAFNYARANEYAERMSKQKKEEEAFEAAVTVGVSELKDMGKEVEEDEYREAVAKVFESFQTDDKGNPIANDYNVAIILTDHPKYSGRVRYDTFLEELTFKCKIGRKYEDHYLENNNNNPALSRLMQDIQFDFFPRISRLAVFSAAVSVGHDADFDSYRDEMDGLIGKWDGKERMGEWLHQMYSLPNDLYHRGVSAQFVFAMVRRAYEPGAEFQKVLFLSGNQGVGKSYGMNILAGGDNYCLEFNDEIAGREFQLHAKGKKVIDLAEGESMQRSSVRRIKALITDNSGVHRTFGSAEVKEHPVRYVMSITNNDSPLMDSTGNRRFLVVKIPLVEDQAGNFTWLKTYRTQILAEAVHKYHEMLTLEEKMQVKIEEAEEVQDTDLLYTLYEEKARVRRYEIKLAERELEFADVHDPVVAKKFESPYGVPLIPHEISKDIQSDARMASGLENEVLAILMSYDEYRAGSNTFFLPTEEVVAQMDAEVVRQSRVGSFLNSEVGRMLKIVDSRLEGGQKRFGSSLRRRGVQFKQKIEGSKERLDAIKAIRKRAEMLKPMPPSQFGGGSKAVSLEEKAAKIRWERDGAWYLVLEDVDIQMEMNEKGSVEVSELIKEEQF